MLRKLTLILIMMSVLTGFQIAPASAQDKLPVTKEAWIEKLSSLNIRDVNTYPTLCQFITQDPEFTYAVLRDGWLNIKDQSVRNAIFSTILNGDMRLVMFEPIAYNSYTANPHLLEIISLWMQDVPETAFQNIARDEHAYQRQQILRELYGIAFQDISGAKEFQMWRNSVGVKPIKTIIQENSRRVVNDLLSGDSDHRLKTLQLLQKIIYSNGGTSSNNNGVKKRIHYASGTMSLRRAALLEANLPAVLGKLIRPENSEEIRQESVKILARFQPDAEVLAPFESDLRRELPLLMEKPAEIPNSFNAFNQSPNFVELLMAFNNDWAAEVVIKRLQKSVETNATDSNLYNALRDFSNPRIIPTLIGMIDLNDPEHISITPIENALRDITRVGWTGNSVENAKDGIWWRLWWHDNKKKYSTDIQKLPIPNFHTTRLVGQTMRPTGLHSRLESVFVSEDPMRAYWLISPSWTPAIPPKELKKALIVNAGLKKPAAEKSDHPGLLVVLLDGETDVIGLLDSWLDVSDALDKKYYIAIAVRPKWNEKTAGQWLTQKDRGANPEAEFTTEAFTEQIVRQMKLNAALNPNHIFLVGEGKAGTAAYSCALQKDTLFSGFCLLSAPIRTTALPSLSAAKNRKFFLATGIVGMGGKDALAAAAESLLKQQGAIVSSEQIKDRSVLEGIKQAVRWLEK